MNLIFALEMLGPILIVGFSRVIAYQDQYFSVEPENQTVVFGSSVVLQCRIVNKSGIAQWTMNDFGLGDKRDLPGYDRYRMIGEDKDGNYSLEIFPVTLEDEGKYECQVGFGPQGQSSLRSRPIWLSVIIPTEPPVILQGSVVDAPEYDEVTLDCLSVAGRPPAEVIWKDDLGNVITENVRHKVKELPDGERFSVTSTLKLIVTRHDNNKLLTCQAQNGGEKPHKTARVTLNVVYPPKVSVTVKSGANPSGRILQGAGISVLRQVFPSLPGPDQEWFIGTQLVFGNKSTVEQQFENLYKADVDCKTIGEPENAVTASAKEGPKILWNLENKIEPTLRNNVTLECTVEGNPLPEIAWIHGNTRQVVTKSNILTLAINHDNIGLYYCKVSIKRLSAVLKSKNSYLITDSTKVGILNTIDRLECTFGPLPQANQVYLSFHNIDINGTIQKYSSLEKFEPSETKTIWLIREFEATGVDIYNWSDTGFHGFDSDFMKTWITTRKSFLVLMTVVGIILAFLVVATLVLMFILSRKTIGKSSFSYSGTKNLCLSDSSSKGSDCKLELVPETDDQSELEFTNDVVPIAPISVRTFRSHNSPSAFRAHPAAKVNINDNYVSYVGYGRDYSPPAATRKDRRDLDRKNSFALAIPNEPGFSTVSDCSNNPYLIALDSLLPESLQGKMVTPRLPCATVWQDVSVGSKTKNPYARSGNSFDPPMPNEITLV